MPYQLIFDSSLPQTFLSFEEKLSGIKATLAAYEAKSGIAALQPDKAVWVPEKQFTKLIWNRILGPAELTYLFLALGPKRTQFPDIIEQQDIFSQSHCYLQDDRFWDAGILVKENWPQLFYLDKDSLPQLDEIFCRNSYLAPASEQLQLVTKAEAIRSFLRERQPATISFKEWVDGNSLKDSCPWFQEIEREERERINEAQRAKAAQEEAAKKARAAAALAEQPRRVLRLAPDCPDWMVEIYRKALLLAIHPDKHNGQADKAKLTQMTAVVNAAYDKIKSQRGQDWNPKKVPWLKGESK